LHWTRLTCSRIEETSGRRTQFCSRSSRSFRTNVLAYFVRSLPLNSQRSLSTTKGGERNRRKNVIWYLNASFASNYSPLSNVSHFFSLPPLPLIDPFLLSHLYSQRRWISIAFHLVVRVLNEVSNLPQLSIPPPFSCPPYIPLLLKSARCSLRMDGSREGGTYIAFPK